ncbi:MAG: hypothetical protein A2283_01725 [Lentisphaerae bacterium RIFOXYA12_FULL_48_11]|nr:MAG: hypothetical protein A2283_01725 [Lentisphaerae bacterium RIFOXYA12_FULL_48_11]
MVCTNIRNQALIIIRSLFLCLLVVETTVAGTSGIVLSEKKENIVPVAVYSPAFKDAKGQNTLNHLIDGDWKTTCCFSPNDVASTSAWFVLDLGEVRKVTGIRFVAQRSWVNCMAEHVSVFACEDLAGKNRRYLRDCCQLPPVTTFNSAFVTWDAIATRYIGVIINRAWDIRCSFDYHSGTRHQAIKKLPDLLVNGGPLYDVCGIGGRLAVQIAEVSCFSCAPSDIPLPNPLHVAYPGNRLERDWMYQDCGVSNVSMVANAVDGSKTDSIGPDISGCFSSGKDSVFEQAMLRRVLSELDLYSTDVAPLRKRAEALLSIPGVDHRWRTLYLDACRERRRERLKVLRRLATQFLYTKHFIMGGVEQWSQTAHVSDEQVLDFTPVFREGSQLCLATINEDGSVSNEVLIDKPEGVIRDPCLSFDAQTLFFSMRDNFKTDDYHLYAMYLSDRHIRQITFSPVVDGTKIPCCDIEPCLTPEGDIIFGSTRCVQLDDCAPRATLNLYKCDVNGRFLRRLAFDQVSTAYPQLLDDGRIIYSRWEYHDRSAYFQQPLFVMNPDGTAQSAFYGNNSIYPTSLIHSRGIPGTGKIITIVGGHHALQKGKLAIIDRTKGSEGNSGIEYVAGASPDGRPGRQPSAVLMIDPATEPSKFSQCVDFYDQCGQIGPQWQYPYAFDEDHYFVSYNPEGMYFSRGPCAVPFGVYYMTATGERELLAFDWDNSCGQAIPLVSRRQPLVRVSQVDWKQNVGRFYVQNVYTGPGVRGIEKGTVKHLRVIALEYRAAFVSANDQHGLLAPSRCNTPISIDNGSQDVKHVLGEVEIDEEGGAYFEVPARNAIYFQLLDAKGRCIQTMRSWAMVQPGEFAGCVGCHETPSQVGGYDASQSAMLKRRPQKLQPMLGQSVYPLLTQLEKTSALDDVSSFLGVNALRDLDAEASVIGFSYVQTIQPILDKNCVACHQGNVQDPDVKKRSALCLTGDVAVMSPPFRWGSPLRKFSRSYLALTSNGKCTPLVNWFSPQSVYGRAMMLSPYEGGSAKSKLMDYLEPSHYDIQMTDAEKRTVACWIDLGVPFCGSYAQANTWATPSHVYFPRCWQPLKNDLLSWQGPVDKIYEYYQNKRVVFARQEIENILSLLHENEISLKY